MLRTIGLMSGTSLDGVDAAWVETDGERIGRIGPALTLPYAPALRRDLRRLLDSSVVSTAVAGRWSSPDHEPPALGSTRHHADWDVASSSSPTGWMVELRIRVAAVNVGEGAPRLAFRTFNDRPTGWWSWPVPPADLPPQRMERIPDLWIPIRLP